MKKRILFTASRFFPYAYGGGEVYIASVASELRKKGWDVRIATLGVRQQKQRPFAVEHSVHNGIPVDALCLHEEALTELEKYSETSEHHRAFVRAVMSDFQPALVHVNGLTLPALEVAKELGIPSVVTVHHSGVVCPAGDLIRPDGSQCQYAEAPGVCIPCTSLRRQPEWYTGGIIGKIPSWLYESFGKRTEHSRDLLFALRVIRYPWLVDRQILHQKKIWELTRHVVVPSQAMKQLLLRNSVDENIIHVLPHGVNIPKRKARGDKTKLPVKFGFIGQIAYAKGVHLIFQALAGLDDAAKYEFHIFGEARSPEEKRYFRAVMEKYPRVSVKNHGYIPHERIHEAYEQIDAVIVPSLAHEAFCLVVHEAFGALKPAIVARAGAMPELVRDGKNGFIFERNDTASLLRIVKAVIESPKIIETMKKQIPAVQSFSAYAREIQKIYQTALY